MPNTLQEPAVYTVVARFCKRLALHLKICQYMLIRSNKITKTVSRVKFSDGMKNQCFDNAGFNVNETADHCSKSKKETFFNNDRRVSRNKSDPPYISHTQKC